MAKERKFIRIQTFVLWLIHFDIFKPATRLSVVVTWTHLILLIAVLEFEVNFVVSYITDLRAMTAGLAPLLCSLLAVNKLWHIQMNRSTFHKFIVELQGMWNGS